MIKKITPPSLYSIPLYPTRLSLLVAVVLLLSEAVTAQVMEVASGPPYTPQNLITNVFLGDGVEVLNVTYQGNNQSVGFFNNGVQDIGMARGIVMTTGFAVTQLANIGVNAPGATQASVPSSGNAFTDPDLLAIAGPGTTINDVCKYTITFRPFSDTLRFKYAFGSEEYPEYVCSGFNDVFGFFINGPGITGPYANNSKNIALIPGTNLPVRINNVNSGQVGANGTEDNCRDPRGSLAFSEFYNDNEGSNQLPVYDGFTDVFIAEAIVMPCSTYTIKLVICDVGDASFDSGVFLEAKSFGSGSIDVAISGLNVDGGLAEGCRSGEIAFTLPRRTEADYDIDFSIGGSALNGVDYSAIPTQITIPAGDSVAIFSLEAFEDNVFEGDETIELSVQLDPCTRDTFVILIKENPLEKPDLGLDQLVCPDQLIQLDGTIPIVLPEPPRFSNTTPLNIAQHNLQYTSSINVQGVLPPTLGPEVIKAVCIDSLSHRWIDDLDIFLAGPDGQFLELTTDNGGNGGNNAQMDFYRGTCFTVDAATAINSPGPFAPPSAVPFTGNWQPEGVWSDLWDSGNRRTNGQWNLLVVDDAMGFPGTLHEWSICFNAPYELIYEWSPATGLSCTDCPNPTVDVPDVPTTYILMVEDSYGCMVSDTIALQPQSTLMMSEVLCGQVTETSIEFVWNDVPGSLGYEVSINGGPWIPAAGALSHQVNNLSFLQEVEIAVRVIGSDCASLPELASCTTLNCTPPELNVIQTNAVSCFDGADGSIALGIGLGTGPFVFEVDGVENTTGFFDDLRAGTYVARATDFFGCVASLSFMLQQPEDPGFTFVVANPILCAGDDDGILTLTVADGNGPYNFNWSSGATDSIAVNLAPDNYTLELTDINGCVYLLDTVLTEPEALSATLAAEPVRCFGEASGQAIVTPTGGVGPYQLSWNDALSQTTDTASALNAGAYEVLVTDANGCTWLGQTNITEPDLLTIAPSATAADCADTPSGAVAVVATGGVPAYAYNWVRVSDGQPIGSSADVADLSAGVYQVEVMDLNGCVATAQTTVTAPPALTMTVATDTPSCFGVADGAGLAAVQGGVGPYTFNWSNGGNMAQTNTLAAGPITLIVTDDNGCSIDTAFVLQQPAQLTASLTTYPVSCFGGANGAAAAQVEGGTLPYIYNWSQPGATDSLSNLSVGTISLQVVDAEGCMVSVQAEVTEFPAFNLSFTPQNPACFGAATGQITATASGGAGGYTYLWSNGQQNAMATGLTAGSYDLVLTDANGCTFTASQTLTEPTQLTSTTSTLPQGCNGPADGQAGVTVAGGTQPYTYAWSNGGLTAQINGLTTGNYSVTVTDAQGCFLTTSAMVGNAPAVVLAYQSTDASCFGQAGGAIQVQVSGGTAPFVYNWSNTALPAAANQANLPAGIYIVTVTDDNLCQAVLNIEIQQPPLINLSADVSNVLCAGETSGAIDLAVSGGVAPYTYLWTNGAVTQDLSSLGAGNYSVQVRDANGCLQSLAQEVIQAPPLIVAVDVTEVSCQGAASGQIITRITGGQSPYTLTWGHGAQGDTLSQLMAGSYELTVTDAFGCSHKETILLEEPPALLASASAEDISCFGEKDGRINIVAEGGTPPYRYRLDGSSIFSGNPSFIALISGSYRVLVRDANGCEALTSSVAIVEPPLLSISLEERLTVPFGDSLQLMPVVSGSLPIVSYVWTAIDSTTMSCRACPKPWVSPPYETDYVLLVVDENGCEAEASIRIVVEKDFPVLVPTGFTPNGDGQNDRLLVHGLPGVQILTFRVFDRWGELVHQSNGFGVNDETQGWDGRFRDQPLNGGVFIWQIEALLPDGETGQFRGQTTLIR